MYEMIHTTIRQQAQTKTEIHRHIELVRQFFEWLFFESETKGMPEGIVGFSQENNLTTQEQQFLTITLPVLVKFYTKETLYDLTKELEYWTEQLPTLIIYTPVSFENDQLKTLAEWTQHELGPESCIEMKLKPELIAGAACAWNNTYQDFSLFADKTSIRTVLYQLWKSRTQTSHANQ